MVDTETLGQQTGCNSNLHVGFLNDARVHPKHLF